VNFIQPALPAMAQAFRHPGRGAGTGHDYVDSARYFFAPLFGVVADLLWAPATMAWGLILYGIFGAAMALAPTFTWLLVLRAMQGVAYSAVIPLTIVLIGDLLEGDHEIGGQGLKGLSRPRRLPDTSAVRRPARDDRVVLALHVIHPNRPAWHRGIFLDA